MKKVVIVGSGFGGMDTALKLRDMDPEVDITVIDAKSYFTYQVSLHELVSKKVRKNSIKVNLPKLYKKHNIRFYRDEVVEIDPLEKSVSCVSRKIGFDYLVIAVGGKANYFGIKGMKENSLGLKSIREALKIRSEIDKLLEHSKYYKEPVNIVVVGGGLTGVETACELADYTGKKAKIIVLEALKTVMKGFDKRAIEYTEKTLKKKGIEVRTDCAVESAERGKLLLDGGEEIKAGLIVWCAGVKPNPLTRNVGLKANERGLLLINNELQTSHPEIYAMGDCTYMYQNPQPMTGLTAIMQSDTIAHNIYVDIHKGDKEVFERKEYPYLISLGRGRGIMIRNDKVKTGFLPAVIKKLLRINYIFAHKHWVWPFKNLEG